MSEKNHQFILVNRPSGMPEEADFELKEGPVPSPRHGEVLVKTLYLSVDPYMRGRMNEAESYAPPVQLGEVMEGSVVGVVQASQASGFSEGDYVLGQLGWQAYGVAPGHELRRVDPSVAPISTALGVLGMPGLTAYFGLYEIGKPRPGETVFVSGAAGAVGSTVGQLAKLAGCRVAGSAGSPKKIDWLKHQLGFDGVFNYQECGNLSDAIEDVCPEGIDVYFDNVGGSLTDAVVRHLNNGARLVICGQISQYNKARPERAPRWLMQLLVKRARAQGFIVHDFEKDFAPALARLGHWVGEGHLRYRESIVDGLEQAPKAFLGLFEGENIGKQLVKVADE